MGTWSRENALAQCFGERNFKKNPNARVKYIPAETFINEFLEHLRLSDMDNFKNLSKPRSPSY